MTHFKLYLLTPQFRDNITVFIEDQITEFYAQEDSDQSRAVKTIDHKERNIYDPNFEYDNLSTQRDELWLNNHNTFAYSYNEKLTKEQNAQKTLTFEMNRYIVTANEWRENPFARNIMAGSMLLLKEFRYTYKKPVDESSNEDSDDAFEYIDVSEEILFTVTNIKYTFKENNTIYSITCQDSFTYQSSRQNQGYNIENNPDTSDFIGAKTIDWWIINKIMPECHMNYQYLSMQTGLYLTKEGHYYTFDINEYDNIAVPNNESILKIVKEPYSPTEDKDYFNSFSFSCSDSNANAAVIALADLINFQINTFEHARYNNDKRSNIFDQYFWVEPKQNDRRLGLEYSPTQSIKSFGLTHKADSLTTILNVTGPTVDEEIVSLIPTVPPFFASVILSGQLWDTSSFNTGFFTNLCKGKLFMNYTNAIANAKTNIFSIALSTVIVPDPNDASIDTDDVDWYSKYIIRKGLFYQTDINTLSGWFDENTEYRYFPIYTTGVTNDMGLGQDGTYYSNYLFDTPIWYNYISFTYNKQYSRIIKVDNDMEEVFQNNGSHWELVVHDLDTDQIFIIRENMSFADLQYHRYRAFVRIHMASDVSETGYWDFPTVYLRFFRIPTTDELDFAEIADTCPWLENKIIDFSYFYTNRIINESEYKALMDIVSNQLRIVNGKLLLYSQAYYNALHQETTILADIQNKLDMLGAECQAAIIDPCANSATPKIDLSSFKQTYLDVTSNNGNLINPILNHTTLLEEYFTKYFNAQQRFLKNVKSFRDYFDTEVNFAAAGLYQYTLSIDLPDFPTILLNKAAELTSKGTTEVAFYSFSNAQFHLIGSNFKDYIGYSNTTDNTKLNNYGEPTLPIYKKEGLGYSRLDVVSQRNYQDYYIPNIHADDMVHINDLDAEENLLDGAYNYEKTYYQRAILVPVWRPSANVDYWYLGNTGENTDYKVNITRTLKSSGEPNVVVWRSLYQVTYNYTNPHTCYGQEIRVNPDKVTGVLVLVNTPISSSSIPDTITHTTIKLGYYKWRTDIFPQTLQWEDATSTKTITTTIDYVLITHKEAINNFLYRELYRSGYSSNYYYRNPDSYGMFQTTDSSYSGVPKYFQDYAARGLIAGFAEGDEANISDPTANWTTSDNSLYVKYFPVSSVYYHGPKYKVIQNDTNDTYYFKRLNKKGQDQKDYYEELSSGLVENPYEYQEYQSLPFITTANEKNYYRRIHGNIAGKIWSGIGTGLVSLAMCFVPWGAAVTAGAWSLYHWLWNHGPTWFAQEGLCNRSFFDSEMGSTTHSGWYDWGSITYALGADSYSTYSNLKEKAVEANSTHTEISFTKWSDALYTYIATNIDDQSLQLVSSSNLNLYGITNEAFYPLIGNQVGFTFSAAVNQYNNTYQRGIYYKKQNGYMLSLTDRLYKGGKYKIIWWDSDIIRNSMFATQLYDKAGTLVDLVRFYPIANAMLPVDLSKLEWTDVDYYTLEDALELCGYTENEEYSGRSKRVYEITLNDRTAYISFFSIEDYERQSLKDVRAQKMLEWPINLYSAQNVVYDQYDAEVDFDKIDTLMNDYYYLATEDESFTQVKEFESIPDFDPTEHYYNSSYQRTYTLHQLINNKPFATYYLRSQSYSEELLSDNVKLFNPTLMKNVAIIDYEYDGDETITSYIIRNFKTLEDRDIYLLDFTDSDNIVVPINDINCDIGLQVKRLSGIRGLTNGAFWYLYHNSTEHPLLLQQAAVIEAQLSEYWQTAYVASKYCEFFLPEHWQPVYDTKTNNFASTLFEVTYPHSGDGLDLTIKVSSQMIPLVRIVMDADLNTSLPRYQFKRLNRPLNTIPTTGAGQYIDEHNSFSALETLTDNNAVVQAMMQIGESLDNWQVEENGKQTYYYAVNNTGMLWPQFLQEATHNYYPEYSGIYVMQYRILREQYRELPMTEYYKYQKLHDHLWNVLYNKYQFMILQSGYKNETATTSKELLQMAQYAFKNRSNPEADYSISILNSAELKGYYGQEIRIGDGIKIDAQQYYNEYDQIYRSLSQYLFISKISYTLRNPIDVSLTVNDVQYEDKIVQRLVKLMK